MNKYINIIYEDDHLLALNKPAGILSIPDRFEHKKPNLKNELLKNYPEIYVIHRLDLETSGLILFAKDAETHGRLSLMMENQEVQKEYLALSLQPPQAQGKINAPIAESLKNKGLYKVHNRGKHALTRYRTLQTWDRYALLSLQLITGRTHQIRVHLRHIQAPLIADEKYGIAPAFYLSQIKKIFGSVDREERPLIARSSLHAYTITMNHPITRLPLTLVAPIPKDFKAAINQLNKRFTKTLTEPFMPI